jgi:hypothetical protein
MEMKIQEKEVADAFCELANRYTKLGAGAESLRKAVFNLSYQLDISPAMYASYYSGLRGVPPAKLKLNQTDKDYINLSLNILEKLWDAATPHLDQDKQAVQMAAVALSHTLGINPEFHVQAHRNYQKVKSPSKRTPRHE